MSLAEFHGYPKASWEATACALYEALPFGDEGREHYVLTQLHPGNLIARSNWYAFGLIADLKRRAMLAELNSDLDDVAAATHHEYMQAGE